ncbi:dienelactone hydrolase family protein [Chondromyces apiculatus]|uniref:Putative dienelactone hydrolase protein n=1 Tax=Chondromyces apiculatus DSM 436 TaxID=1192034 RepID=A0A017TFQ6_9BACT|nr:dienelactone hydrolase family protein [Chondromyces apiculatus]EYF07767.1 putative dienelactone hydrolase protein [Chondromyces apiculatus DSM 436]
MGLKTEWVHYGEGQKRLGYFCVPEGVTKPLPAVLVLQEALGVDEHIEDVTRRFAQAGYAALAPDLYAPEGKRLPELTRARVAETMGFLGGAPRTVWRDAKARAEALSSRPEEEAKRIEASFVAMMAHVVNMDLLIPALLDATRWLREECPQTRGQKVGSVGYCMGGGLSGLLATHDPELAAAVIYYGRSPDPARAEAIRCPVFGFYGGDDEGVNATVPAFAEAMQKAGKRFEQQVYPGVQHAFFNDTRPSYDAGASRDAFSRTLDIFRAELT